MTLHANPATLERKMVNKKTVRVNSSVSFFPRPGEKTDNLAGRFVFGNCLAPVMYEGDYIVLDTKASPKPGDYVSYEGVGYRFSLGEDGHALLTNGIGTLKPPDTHYEGVIVQVNRVLRRGERRGNKGGRPRLPNYSELTASQSKKEGGNASHKANLKELKRLWAGKPKVSLEVK